MTHLTKVALLLGVLALAACSTSADRFGTDPSGGFGADGIASSGIGDPTSAGYFQQQVGDRVLFVVDTSDLTPQAQDTLRGQAQFLMSNAGYTAIIEGHADERGTREYNIALGARRATAVQDFLVSQGVAPNRLRTVSYGKERPLEVCSVESCYAQNRRAVTVLGAGVGS
ncbi:MAG: peptidoglycan-associated lipoprotein Pal [Pseudomonadota bacterium]